MGSCFSLEGRTPIPGSPTSSPSGFQRKKTSKKTNYWRDEALNKVPGRFFSNGSTEIASLFTQQGKKGTNQDAMIVWENFSSRKDTVFCGVFDGHGPYGHLVAKRVRDSLPLKLSAHWKVVVNGEDIGKEVNAKATTSLGSEEIPLVAAEDESSKASVLACEEAENPPEIFGLLKESFLKAFKVMDRELRMHPSIDCFCSGTTAVTLIKQGKYIVLGNVGDSRAVLGTRDEKGSLVAVQLTIDLKPNLPVESERIRKCKGRVFALQGEPDVARVWLPNNMSPGLAMARAFGDFCLKDYGLISVPDISCRCLNEKDEFVVLATDGVWDVLTNKEVVDIIASAPTRSSAARALVESAVRTWRYKYPTSKVDDCAVVCLFLDSNDLYTASSEPKSKETSNQVDSSAGGGTTVSKKNIADESAEEDEEEEEEEEEDADAMDSQEKDWSALEGVSRANTLLDLPRF